MAVTPIPGLDGTHGVIVFDSGDSRYIECETLLDRVWSTHLAELQEYVVERSGPP